MSESKKKTIKISCGISYSEEPLIPIMNDNLYNDLIKIKSEIDHIDSKKWYFCRNLTNDYEYICDKHPYTKRIPYNMKYSALDGVNQIKIPMYQDVYSRSFFKLWEIMRIYEKKMNICSNDPLICVTLAEGPGGFLQSILEYRCNKPTKIYGITLRDGTQNITKWNNKFFQNDKVILTYGDKDKNHDGDLMNHEILEYFCNYVTEGGKKIDIVTADGGYSISVEDENLKEQIHFPLFYNEAICALSIQKKGGCFILKIYDMFTLPTCQLFALLSIYYKEVFITKPLTSRPANSERYVVCLGFKGITKKELNKLHKTSLSISNNAIRYKSVLTNGKYEKTKRGSFISSIFKNEYCNNDIKSQIQDHNNEFIPSQIDNISHILSLISDMNRNERIGDIETNSEIFSFYEMVQNRNAIQWCRYNEMPFNSKYSLSRYV
jgi:23S rRNA U2552 (ribose-2'-O)-methylase RlmE/FtsJ